MCFAKHIPECNGITIDDLILHFDYLLSTAMVRSFKSVNITQI